MASTTVEPALFVDCRSEEFAWVKEFFDLVESNVMHLQISDFYTITTKFAMQDEGKMACDLVLKIDKALKDSLKPIEDIIFY